MDMNTTSEVDKMKRKKFKKLYDKIKKQMEFYFCDSNLAKDKFLTDLISKEPDGFVDIEVFKSFNKIKALAVNCDTDICSLIAASVAKSDMFEVSEDQKKLRRTTPVDIKDFDACTLYVEKLPPHADHKWVQDVFRHFGSVKHVNVPRYKVTNKIKGFAFVEFENSEGVKNACEYYKVLPEKECSASEDESKNIKNVKKTKSEEAYEKKNKKRARSVSESSDKTDVSSSKHEKTVEDTGKNSDPDTPQKRKRKRGDSESDAVTKKLKESADALDASADKPKEEQKRDTSVKKSEDVPLEKEAMDTEGQNVQDSDPNGTEMETEEGKNKRKRRKRHRSGAEKPSLRVMPKSEWKIYRNKYLDLQRTTMKYIKRQILLETQELKEQENHIKSLDMSEPKKGLSFIPDVIIKVKLLSPVKNSTEVKEQVKACAVVAYIDAPLECTEIFIRCHNADEALSIVKEDKLNQLGKAELLKGDEEKRYWEKIESDRKVKYSNPVSHKKRGRDKLMAKAAKLEEIKNKHIYFDD